jgi:hypothetical protein
MGERLERSAHGSARGDAVVDDNHGAALERHRLANTVGDAAAFGLFELARQLSFYISPVCAHHPCCRLDNHQLRRSAINQGTDTIFLVTRCANLSHQQDVERRGQFARNFVANRNAVARQGQDQAQGLDRPRQ